MAYIDERPIEVNSRIETEEVLGSLPETWEKFQWSEKKYLYVDHEHQTTTWIDPRTYSIRKLDIRECVYGELPYGWEEAFDQNCGVYYINHLNQTHYLEGPWTEETRKLVLGESEDQEHANEKPQATTLEEKRAELLVLQTELETYEAQQNGIQQELDRVRTELEAQSSNMDLRAKEDDFAFQRSSCTDNINVTKAKIQELTSQMDQQEQQVEGGRFVEEHDDQGHEIPIKTSRGSQGARESTNNFRSVSPDMSKRPSEINEPGQQQEEPQQEVNAEPQQACEEQAKHNDELN